MRCGTPTARADAPAEGAAVRAVRARALRPARAWRGRWRGDNRRAGGPHPFPGVPLWLRPGSGWPLRLEPTDSHGNVQRRPAGVRAPGGASLCPGRAAATPRRAYAAPGCSSTSSSPARKRSLPPSSQATTTDRPPIAPIARRHLHDAPLDLVADPVTRSDERGHLVGVTARPPQLARCVPAARPTRCRRPAGA